MSTFLSNIFSEKMKISVEAFLFLYIFISQYTTELEGTDWCDLPCYVGDDQMIANIGCNYTGECSTPKAPCKFIPVDRAKMLATHNDLRREFATGKHPYVPDIQVSNMMALVWDDDLAFLSGCNLMECNSEMEHDYCHSTKKFEVAGQNIAKWSGKKECSKKDYFALISMGWYDAELRLLTPEEVKKMGELWFEKEGTGHFTQFVWAITTHVGCMMWEKPVEGKTLCILTCNYGPTGNMEGDGMFKSGKPASACPKGTFPINGLCSTTSATGRLIIPMEPLVIGFMITKLFTFNIFL